MEQFNVLPVAQVEQAKAEQVLPDLLVQEVYLVRLLTLVLLVRPVLV
jgi:hypothetical protein